MNLHTFAIYVFLKFRTCSILIHKLGGTNISSILKSDLEKARPNCSIWIQYNYNIYSFLQFQYFQAMRAVAWTLGGGWQIFQLVLVLYLEYLNKVIDCSVCRFCFRKHVCIHAYGYNKIRYIKGIMRGLRENFAVDILFIRGRCITCSSKLDQAVQI